MMAIGFAGIIDGVFTIITLGRYSMELTMSLAIWYAQKEGFNSEPPNQKES